MFVRGDWGTRKRKSNNFNPKATLNTSQVQNRRGHQSVAPQVSFSKKRKPKYSQDALMRRLRSR